METIDMQIEAVVRKAIAEEVNKLRTVRIVEDRWLNKEEASRYLGVSTSTFDRFRSDPNFPAGRKLGAATNSRVVWKMSELDAWMETRPEVKEDRCTTQC